MHGGKEEIRDRLAGGRGSGDRPELGIVGSGKRERLVERRRATALALGEATKRLGQVVQRVAQAKRQATIRSTAMTMTGPSPAASPNARYCGYFASNRSIARSRSGPASTISARPSTIT